VTDPETGIETTVRFDQQAGRTYTTIFDPTSGAKNETNTENATGKTSWIATYNNGTCFHNEKRYNPVLEETIHQWTNSTLGLVNTTTTDKDGVLIKSLTLN
jgi:hypothetical protein